MTSSAHKRRAGPVFAIRAGVMVGLILLPSSVMRAALHVVYPARSPAAGAPVACGVRSAEEPMIGRAQTGWMPVIVAALVSGVLLTATYFIRRSVHDSSYLIARGMGEVFFLSGWERLGGEAYPPTAEALRQFLDAHTADGLRYVGLVDEKGEISVSAGEAVGSGFDDGVKLFGDRARLVARLRPRRPPGPPPPRPTTEN